MAKTQTPATTTADTAITKAEPTAAERFTGKVTSEFQGAVGQAIELTPFQKKLAASLYVSIDNALNALEAKRTGDGLPITWKNVNMNKLAVDAMHRINLGLDAGIKNHIHVVPYFNAKTNKYDIDLRQGHEGKLYVRKQVAVDQPKQVILQLVYKTDHFKPLMRDANRASDDYEFEVKDPFNRGDIIGGFGYITYDDPTKNTLVIVSAAEFEKSRAKAQSDKFWTDWYIQMCYKTLAHRVSEKIEIDPKKANNSFHIVEADERREFEEQHPELKGMKEIEIDIDDEPKQITSDLSSVSKPVANDPAPGVLGPFD